MGFLLSYSASCEDDKLEKTRQRDSAGAAIRNVSGPQDRFLLPTIPSFCRNRMRQTVRFFSTEKDLC